MKTEPKLPLLLFYASRQIGGGEAYFINLGLAAIRSGRRCIVVDYSGGYVISRIPGAEHIVYDDESGADFTGSCVAFMPIGGATFLGDKLSLNPSSKVLLVSIHHNHAIELGSWGWLLRRLSPALAGFIWPIIEPCRFRVVRRFFQEICRLKGLAYCAPFQRDFDEEYLGCTLHAQVVPIPLPGKLASPAEVIGQGRAIVWVSRFAKEKAAIIEEVIAGLKSARAKHKLILIGEGPEYQRIKRVAAEAGLEFEMPGVVAGSALVCYLRQHALLCVGVGTAAAEMAAAGLPTLVAGLPGAYAGRYAWFHQSRPGDTIVTSANCHASLTLSEALKELESMNRRQAVAAACADAAISRHDIDASWKQLSGSLEESQLEARQVISLLRMKQQPFSFIRMLKHKLRKSARPLTA
jgi:glycosyltransferase involved in cell wall biosynthesis